MNSLCWGTVVIALINKHKIKVGRHEVEKPQASFFIDEVYSVARTTTLSHIY